MNAFEEELENENDSGIRISRYSFNSFRIERSIRDLISLEERKMIVIPEFQREFVWDYKKCCKFIESILLSLPVPDMFIFRDRNNFSEKFILIDGLQRFTCIKQFMNGKYQTKHSSRPFAIRLKNSEWDRATYDSLSQEDRNLFDDYSLKFNVFDSIENDESTKMLYMTEIFERINTGSEKLTDQEIRNAVYNGEFSSLLKEFATYGNFRKLLLSSKKYISRCADQEFILRCLTYYQITNQILNDKKFFVDNEKITISGSKKVMLSQYMFCANRLKIDFRNDLEQFKRAIDYISEFDEGIFRSVSVENKTVNNYFNEVLAEAIIVAVMNGKQFCVSKEEFEKRKINFWVNTISEENPFYWGTTNLKNIEKRFYLICDWMK